MELLKENIILPRYVSYDNDNEKYIIDKNKIIINNEEDLNDKYLLKNILNCNIITNNIYPLIYDNSYVNENMKCRSLHYYKEVINNIELYNKLNDEQITQFNIGIRDLFFSSEENLLSKEVEIFESIVNLLNDEIQNININGIDVSYYPKKLLS